jgi:hypothetical protein
MTSGGFWRIKSRVLGKAPVVSGQSEPVTGMIPVNARLGIGFEQLQLVVTDRRIIVVHKAKKGAGGLVSALILGRHSGAFEDPDKIKPDLGHKRFQRVDVEKVLASNKNNFDLSYSEIISVELEDGRDSTSMTLVTGEDKFQFYASLEAKEINNLLSEHLGPKIVTKKTGTR